MRWGIGCHVAAVGVGVGVAAVCLHVLVPPDSHLLFLVI